MSRNFVLRYVWEPCLTAPFLSLQLETSGVYAEEERKFVYNNVIVGRKATARFKISNNQKVPCDVVFTVKPVAAKGASKQQDIFEVEPSRAQVMNHSYVYATVTFTPPSMQVSWLICYK